MFKKQYGTKSIIYKRLEKKVPKYSLPDPLEISDNSTIFNKDMWINSRRNEILKLFEENVYGITPISEDKIKFEIEEEDNNALGGIATRKQVNISLLGDKSENKSHLLIYLPNNKNSGPIPAFIGLNFHGNHLINSDPKIKLTENWVPNSIKFKTINNTAGDESRGLRSERWPIKFIVEHGYAIATMYYGDITPDHKEGLKIGINSKFHDFNKENRSVNAWGAIGAWSFGLSRIMDYFEMDSDIDSNKVIVFGHSRLGKTSLWAGAQDERFSGVISNCSGCGGAALSRRHFGENVKRINHGFPHWFSLKFRIYDENENALPIDQHMLISLIAPRPIYVASASIDLWADPLGEFLSLKNAESVYELFSEEKFNTPNIPDIEKPITGLMSHHIRKGDHNMLLYDWDKYIKFADMNL